MVTEQSGATVYRQSVSSSAMLVAISVAGLALSILSFQLGIFELKWQLGGVAICGLLTIVFTTQLIRRQPELVLTDTGIRAAHYGEIAWFEIDHVRLRSHSAGTDPTGLDFILRDPDATLDHVSRFVRWFLHPAKGNPKHGIIDISLSGIPVTSESVIHTLHQHQPKLPVVEE